RRHPDPEVRAAAQARVDLVVPLVKAWSTDCGVEIASLGVQVHGGAGFIEETGAAQFYRDCRITPIYEGTNGIQAIDLVGRKILRDRGDAVLSFLREVRETQVRHAGIAASLSSALSAVEVATQWILDDDGKNPHRVLAGATPYLRALSLVAGGWLMARAANIAAEGGSAGDRDFYTAKLATARFYAASLLPQAAAFASAATSGADDVMALAAETF
ncbi:MAG: acyl-CoA dehydrogenase, partial [Rhodospirillaceae bacterium]